MKRILLADDETSLRTLVRTTLEDPDFQIIEVGTGTEALATIRRVRPDLVLLDWMMPGMTGLDVLKEMRADGSTRAIPVIMLTARGQERDRAQAIACGATAFLVKPFSPLELIEHVSNAMSARSQSDEARGAGCPALTEELETKLHECDAQIAFYARDLKRAVDAERTRSLELARANEKLRALNRLKTDFLSFVSHHLRTPLTALSAFDMFDVKGDPKEQAEVIDIVRTGFDQMHALIDRTLDYFDWLGREPVASGPTVDLAELVQRIATERARRFGSPPLRLQCPPEPCLVHGEERHFTDVIQVLLDNAVKFSASEKPIDVTLSRDGARLSLSVRDRGVGISTEFASRLFEPFSVADVEHLASGKGLNLAVARAIVCAHGGDIRLEKAGARDGSTFVVDLPLAFAVNPVPTG